MGLTAPPCLHWDPLVFLASSSPLYASFPSLFFFYLSSVCFSATSHFCVLSPRLLRSLSSTQLNLSCPWRAASPSPQSLPCLSLLSSSKPVSFPFCQPSPDSPPPSLLYSLSTRSLSLSLSSCPLGLSSLFSFAMTSLFHLTPTSSLSPSFQSATKPLSSFSPSRNPFALSSLSSA